MISRMIAIHATPIEIFQFWEDVESWQLWNDGLREFHLPAGFCFGSGGWVVGPSGRRTRISIAHINYPHSFAIEISYPLCKVIFEVRLRTWQGITHTSIQARFTGVMAPIWRRLYVRRIDTFAEATLQALKTVAEQGLSEQLSNLECASSRDQRNLVEEYVRDRRMSGNRSS